MSNEKDKKFLEDLKRQVESLTYYLRNIKLADKDHKNNASLDNAVGITNSLNRAIADGIYDLSRQTSPTKHAEIDEKYKVALGNINSPTENMKKQAETNMAIKNGIIGSKSNLIREAFLAMQKRAAEYGSNLQKKAAEETSKVKRADAEQNKPL